MEQKQVHAFDKNVVMIQWHKNKIKTRRNLRDVYEVMKVFYLDVYIPHLKHILWNFLPAAGTSSAA